MSLFQTLSQNTSPRIDTSPSTFFGDHEDFLAQKHQECELQRLNLLAEQQAMVESYRAAVEHAIAQESYCPQLAAHLWRWATHHHARENGQTPSLEAINDGTLPNVYLEIKEALESVSERLKEKVEERHRHLAGGLMSDGKQQKRQEAAAYIQQRATDFQKRLGETSDRKLSLDGIAARLSVNGAVPRNVVKAVRSDLASCRTLMDTYLKGAVEFSNRSRKVFENVAQAGPDTVERELNSVVRMPLPARQFTTAMTDGSGWMGDMILRVELIEESVDDPYQRIMAITKLKPPMLVSQKLKTPAGEEITLRKRDLTALIRALNSYGDLLESANKTLAAFFKTSDSNTGDASTTSGQTTTSEVKGRRDRKAIKQVGELVHHYPSHITSVAPAGFNHIRQSAKAVILILERALKA